MSKSLAKPTVSSLSGDTLSVKPGSSGSAVPRPVGIAPGNSGNARAVSAPSGTGTGAAGIPHNRGAGHQTGQSESNGSTSSSSAKMNKNQWKCLHCFFTNVSPEWCEGCAKPASIARMAPSEDSISNKPIVVRVDVKSSVDGRDGRIRPTAKQSSQSSRIKR